MGGRRARVARRDATDGLMKGTGRRHGDARVANQIATQGTGTAEAVNENDSSYSST